MKEGTFKAMKEGTFKAMNEGTLIVKKPKDAKTVVPSMKKINAEPKIKNLMDVENKDIT